ncbi:Alpha/Beta hydrolase protein [Chytriomyces sp. MP71]|nr:Alpha/Beta hydrolase protein [Chytriomyces sp. MP71]
MIVPVTGVIAAALLWLQRKQVLGLVARILFLELPCEALLRLVSGPQQAGLDALSTAVIKACLQLSLGSHNPAQLKRLLNQMSAIDAFVARSMGAVLVPCKFESATLHVEGLWIAERTEDIPTPVAADDIVVLLYVHGGGYVLNTAEVWAPHHHELVKNFNAIQKEKGSPSRLVVFSLEYPMAPEHVWPEQVNSALVAFEWLNVVVQAKNILVGGDSAGGHCSISMLNKIAASPRLAALPVQPCASILLSPWVDPGCTVPLKHDVFDYVATKKTIELAQDFCGDKFTLESPDILLKGSQVTVAPRGTLIIYGAAERLRTAIDGFVEELQEKAQVNNLQVIREPGMCHVYSAFLLAFPGTGKTAAMSAIKKAATFIDTAIKS